MDISVMIAIAGRAILEWRLQILPAWVPHKIGDGPEFVRLYPTPGTTDDQSHACDRSFQMAVVWIGPTVAAVADPNIAVFIHGGSGRAGSISIDSVGDRSVFAEHLARIDIDAHDGAAIRTGHPDVRERL